MDFIGTLVSPINDLITMFQSGGAIVYILTIIGFYGLFLQTPKFQSTTSVILKNDTSQAHHLSLCLFHKNQTFLLFQKNP